VYRHIGIIYSHHNDSNTFSSHMCIFNNSTDGYTRTTESRCIRASCILVQYVIIVHKSMCESSIFLYVCVSLPFYFMTTAGTAMDLRQVLKVDVHHIHTKHDPYKYISFTYVRARAYSSQDLAKEHMRL
jgi:hypothetical protein